MNIIYRITNSITGKVYIGQSIEFEIREKKHNYEYKSGSGHLYNSMRKYGFDNFKIEPIYSVLDYDDLNDMEIFFISEYNTFNNGYNMTIGGYGHRGYKHTKETLKKKSKKLKGRFVGKKSSQWKGYYHTPFGKLTTSTECVELSMWCIQKWCKNPDRIINKAVSSQSKYLTEADIGKTYRELGFWFEP